jgi:alcohol oxidase
MESYGAPNGDKTVHGYAGPLSISTKGSEIARQFMGVLKDHYEIEVCDDLQDFKIVNKVGLWPKFIDAATGKRADAAHAYVHPVRDRQNNLHILLESKVVRVLFDGTRASGIEYVQK